jgi:hypothetical protein
MNAVAEPIAGQLHDRLGQGSKRRMRHAANGIDPHFVRHGDVAAARIGRNQRTARLPEVTFGIEMQHLRAHAGIAGALQDAAAAAADWIGQRRIAERELVVAVRVILMLARIATGLRKLPVDAGASRSRHDGKDAVEHLSSRKILVEPEMHQITNVEGETKRFAVWKDVIGLDSEHDYDPVCAKCLELNIAPSFHSGARRSGLRLSPSNFVYNPSCW